MSPRTRTAWIPVALTLPAFLVLVALTCLAIYPARARADQPAANPTTMSFPATGVIRMELNKGAIEIVGAAVDRISVSWRAADADLDRDVSVRLQRTSDKEAKLVLDGPANRVRYRIEVPRESDVVIHMHAGDLNVSGIAGSVDAGLGLGNMELRVAAPERYRNVSASLTAGEISASPWGIEKGGLWRSFKASSDGDYDLRAHMFAGQITIRPE